MSIASPFAKQLMLGRSRRPSGDIVDLIGRADREAKNGDTAGSALTLLQAIGQTHSRESEYERAATTLARRMTALGEFRAALSASWYSEGRGQQETLLKQVPPIDRARTYALWADRGEMTPKTAYGRAAELLESEGALARAAIYYERAEASDTARALWSRLADSVDADGQDHYVAGLARFNVARISNDVGDETLARAATVLSVHRLEEAADRFEAVGQRERAFDCYHVLIAIGRMTHTFEHVLEGCVNAIRILSEDNLRYHSLRLYEHAIELAEQAGEHSAGASLARDMTDYARKQGLRRLAARGVLRQATLWQSTAGALLERGSPVEFVENALLASVLAHAEAGQYARVAALYRQLGELDLEPARRSHYSRAAQRYVAADDRSTETGTGDDRLGRHVEPPDVWLDDLIEWEERGRASEACANVVLDPDEQSDSITRRAALVGRITALCAEAIANSDDTAGADRSRALESLARELAPIELYSVLAPLEELYRSDDAAVRVAAIEALARYSFKRTFVTLEQALLDEDQVVVEAARSAVERLRFDHAFDPLARIYRTSDGKNREAALRALARIDIVEAAELMLGALDHGGPSERAAALSALRAGRGSKFLEAARTAYPEASARLKTAIEEVFESRGVRLD